MSGVRSAKVSSERQGFRGSWGLLWLGLTLAVLAVGFYKAMTAPTEETMGNLQRIFYYHFPNVISAFCFPT